MRELKFRSWDGTKMSTNYMMLRNTDGVLFSSVPDVVIMQFTGLLDKNGKEIYEGDILEFNYSRSGNKTVFDVRWRGKGFKPTRMSTSNRSEMEVIGNIYESPDLLKS